MTKECWRGSGNEEKEASRETFQSKIREVSNSALTKAAEGYEGGNHCRTIQCLAGGGQKCCWDCFMFDAARMSHVTATITGTAFDKAEFASTVET